VSRMVSAEEEAVSGLCPPAATVTFHAVVAGIRPQPSV